MSHWDLDTLFKAPTYRQTGEYDGLDMILYGNEPYHGQPTEVFAYLGLPEDADPAAPVPGMILVHGGGGQAFPEWVQLWRDRGYAALAMDLAGRDGAGNRLPNGGPDQTADAKFDTTVGWDNMWTYHAVAAIIRAHSLLCACPGVDPNRIGITGISWGGYLTCILAGVDHRFAAAIPVYGCGHLQRNSHLEWMARFAAMTPAARQMWHDYCDPAVYLVEAQMPMLFVSGTNDNAYPLDSLKRSYTNVPGPVTLCVRLRMAHSHVKGWAPAEISAFTDHLFRNTPPLPQIGPPIQQGRHVYADFTSASPISQGHLLYTTDSGRWQDRLWYQEPARLEGGTVVGDLAQDTRVCFLALTDEAGNYTSSPHEEIR